MVLLLCGATPVCFYVSFVDTLGSSALWGVKFSDKQHYETLERPLNKKCVKGLEHLVATILKSRGIELVTYLSYACDLLFPLTEITGKWEQRLL